MAGHYISSMAACPYYHNEAAHEVRCEGVGDGCSAVHAAFANPGDKKFYAGKYCRAVKGWEDCRIARLLAEKYK